MGIERGEIIFIQLHESVTIVTIKFPFLQYVANNGPNFILLTNQHASKQRLVSFNFNTFKENQKFTDFIAVGSQPNTIYYTFLVKIMRLSF